MLEEKFDPTLRPKRILSLDGGGIRGVATLEFLERIESILASRSRDPASFRLSDYFDLIGGTSTGAIIAAALAFGMRVDEIKVLYHTLAKSVFKGSALRYGVFIPKFPSQPLRQVLDSVFGDARMNSTAIRTGLVIVTKRLNTGSPWPIHNNPFSHYPEKELKRRDAFRVSELVRASTAAPHYFEPEYLIDASGIKATFVDGGMSTANNPALQLLMIAALTGYGFRWLLGEDNLLLVSVGTGNRPWDKNTQSLETAPALQLAGLALISMMDDCDALAQTLLQWMGRSRTPPLGNRQRSR